MKVAGEKKDSKKVEEAKEDEETGDSPQTPPAAKEPLLRTMQQMMVMLAEQQKSSQQRMAKPKGPTRSISSTGCQAKIEPAAAAQPTCTRGQWWHGPTWGQHKGLSN